MKRRMSFLLAVVMCCSLLLSCVQPTAKAQDAPDSSKKLSPYLSDYLENIPEDEIVPIGVWLKAPSDAEIESMISVPKGEISSYTTAKRNARREVISGLTTAFVQDHLDKADEIIFQSKYIPNIWVNVPKAKIAMLASLDAVTQIDYVGGYEEEEMPTAIDPYVAEKLSGFALDYIGTLAEDELVPVSIRLKEPSAEEIEAMIPADSDISAKRKVLREVYSGLTTAFVKNNLDENDEILFRSNYLPTIWAIVPKAKIISLASLEEVTGVDVVAGYEEEEMPTAIDPYAAEKLSGFALDYIGTLAEDELVPVSIRLKEPSAEEIEALVSVAEPDETTNADGIQSYISAKRKALRDIYSELTTAFTENNLDEKDEILFRSNYLPTVWVTVPKSKILTLAALEEVTRIGLVDEYDNEEMPTDVDPAAEGKYTVYLRDYLKTAEDYEGIPIGINLKDLTEAEIDALVALPHPDLTSTEEEIENYNSLRRKVLQEYYTGQTTAFATAYLDEGDEIIFKGKMIPSIWAIVPKIKIASLAALDEVTSIDLVEGYDQPGQPSDPCDPEVTKKLSSYLQEYMASVGNEKYVAISIWLAEPTQEEIDAMFPVSVPGASATLQEVNAYIAAKRKVEKDVISGITGAFAQNHLDETDVIYFKGKFIPNVVVEVPKSKILSLAELNEVKHINASFDHDQIAYGQDGEPVDPSVRCEHEYKTAVTAPTCTEAGFTTYTCDRCGDEYSDGWTDALSHDWDEGVVTKEPTETETGVRTFTCTRCGETRTEDIPVKEHVHAYTDVVTAPTCTEAGFTTHTCACGDSYQDAAVPALGHSFGEWTDSKAATCTEKGEQTRACTRCEAKETREIDVLGHDFKDGVCTRCEAKDPEYKEPVADPFRFDDVKDDKQFYYEPVYWAVEQKITKGTREKLFSPDDGCTRAQVVTFLWRAAGEPVPTKTENPFKDVKETDYFYKAVLWAVEKGITKGTSADKFSPDATCTRAQIVTFLYRAEGTPEIAKKSKPFHDVDEGQYYADAVAWAVENGVTTGKSADTFAPEATCTRAEVVTFLYRSYTGPKPQNPDTAGGPPVYYTASSVEELTQWIKTAEVEPSYTWGSLYPFLKAARDLGQILAVHPASEDYSLQEILVQCNREQMDYFFVKGNERLEVLVELPGTDGNPKLSLDERIGQINSDLALEYESLQYAKASATVNGKETDVYYSDGGEYTKIGSEQKELFGPSAFFEYEGHEVLIRGIGSLYGCKWDSTYLDLFQFDFVELE